MCTYPKVGAGNQPHDGAPSETAQRTEHGLGTPVDNDPRIRDRLQSIDGDLPTWTQSMALWCVAMHYRIWQVSRGYEPTLSEVRRREYLRRFAPDELDGRWNFDPTKGDRE